MSSLLDRTKQQKERETLAGIQDPATEDPIVESQTTGLVFPETTPTHTPLKTQGIGPEDQVNYLDLLEDEEIIVKPSEPHPGIEHAFKLRDIESQMKDLNVQRGQLMTTDIGMQQQLLDREIDLQNQHDAVIQSAQEQFNNELNTALVGIDTERQALAQKSPKTFWAKADTSDKIFMSLAVLLGGLGQGLSGSRQNAALEAMNRAIDTDIKLQQSRIDQQFKTLLSKEKSAERKHALNQQKIAKMEAVKLASLDQLRNLYQRAGLSMKNSEGLIALQEQNLKLDQDLAEKELAAAERVAGPIALRYGPQLPDAITTEQAEQEFTKLQKNPEMRATVVTSSGKSKPANFTEAQGKSGNVLMAAPEVQELESIEAELSPMEYEKLQEGIQRVMTRDWWAEIPGFGKLIRGGADLVEPPAEFLEGLVPGKGARYYRALFAFTDAQTRYKTGAAIKADENPRDFFQYSGVQPGVNYQDRHKPANQRRRILTMHRRIAGDLAPELLWFQKVKQGK